MRRRLAIATTLLAVLVGGAVAARGEIAQTKNLRIVFDGGFSPRKLPRHRNAPITVSIEGRVATVDGTHPPPLKRLTIELNRGGDIAPAGVPVCSVAALQATSTKEALQRCGPALVGTGKFAASLAIGGEVPARGRVLVFNGSTGQRPQILLHFFSSVPVQATLILPLSIAQRRSGRYGTVLSTKIPSLAGGFGSITELSLEVGRTVGSGADRHGYLNASCAAPNGFPGAPFPFARGKFIFGQGLTIRATLNRYCRVRGE